MKTQPNYPPCPRCKTNRGVIAVGDDRYYCHNCHGIFDGHPNEGGDYSDRNPAARIERDEREAERRRLAVRQGVKTLVRR